MDHDTAALDELIAEITVDCHDEDEQLSGFLVAFTDQIDLPLEAEVLDITVQILGFDIHGKPEHAHRALSARDEHRQGLPRRPDLPTRNRGRVDTRRLPALPPARTPTRHETPRMDPHLAVTMVASRIEQGPVQDEPTGGVPGCRLHYGRHSEGRIAAVAHAMAVCEVGRRSVMIR